jgi:O-antigen ligase
VNLAAFVFALRHYSAAITALLFLNIALISLSIYAFPLPGGYDLQLNRAPLLLAIPLWLVALFCPPYRSLRFRFSPAFLWFVLFLVYALFSAVYLGENPRTATSQLVALVFRGVLFIWLPQIIVHRRQLELASYGLVVAGLLIVAFALFQYTAWFTGWAMDGYRFAIPFADVLGMRETLIQPTGRIGPLFRLTLPFGSSSHLGPAIAALLLVAIGLWLHGSRRGGWRARFLLVYSTIMFILLLGTYSRGAWVGFAAGLATFALLDERLLLQRRVWRILLLALLVAGIALLALAPYAGTVLARFNLAETQSSDQAHLRLFSQAVELFSTRPIAGIGWANYQARTGVLHAHNIYMTILTEAGIIGLALWLLLCGAVSLHGVRAVRVSPRGSFLWYWNLGLLGAYVSVLVNNLFQTSAYFGFAWLLAGLVIASHFVSVSGIAGAHNVRTGS